MSTRVNINIPDALYKRAQQLIKKGIFANFSEVVRESLRKSLIEYQIIGLSMEEKKLIKLIQEAEKKGFFLSESEMKKHGLDLQ